MSLVFSVITGILAFAAVLSLLWASVGIPVGIILLILKALGKFQFNKKKAFWCFGGILFILGIFVLYFIVAFIEGFFGLSIPGTTFPSIPVQH